MNNSLRQGDQIISDSMGSDATHFTLQAPGSGFKKPSNAFQWFIVTSRFTFVDYAPFM